MKQLTQTNRTILFTKFNSEKSSLSKLFLEIDDENIKAVSDAMVDKIEKELVVSSWSEFLKKFDPAIYYRSNGDGEIEYSSSNDGIGNWQKLSITADNEMIKTLTQIIDGKSGKNIDFDYEKILNKMLGVEAASKNVDTAISNVNYLLGELEKKTEGTPAYADAKKRLEKEYRKCVTTYSNPLSLLPWYQKKVVAALETKNTNGDFSSSVGGETATLLETSIMTDKVGIPIIRQVEVKKMNDKPQEDIDNDSGEVIEQENKYELMLSDVYDQGVSRGLAVYNDTGKRLLSTVFAQPDSATKIQTALALMPKEDLIKTYNDFAKQIDSQYKSFASVAKKLLSDIIGVRTFFEQCKCKSNKMPLKLLIANNDPADFQNDSDKLLKYLEKVNNTESDYSKAIWFAVVPNVACKDAEEDDGWGDEEETTSSTDDAYDSTEVISLIKVLKEYRVQTFMGFENNKDNTFANVQQYGIEKINGRLR